MAHLAAGIASAFVLLAFLAVHAHLREMGEARWSGPALTFVVLGSTLYAILPGADVGDLTQAHATPRLRVSPEARAFRLPASSGVRHHDHPNEEAKMTKRASGPATGVTPKQAGTEHGSDAPAPRHGTGGPSTPAQPAGSIEETKAAWDRIAPGYDHFVTASRGWALPVEVLQRAGLREGMRFLDVASGSGALSLPAGRIGARVLAVDISPEMIERLRARARDEGLPNVEGRVMDGHALDLDDGLFDLAASQFGVMLFPDLPRALREMVRVTRPGGQVMLVAYGPPPTVEFLGFFLEAIGRVVPDFSGPPMDPPPLPFQVADPDVLRSRMVEAGLVDVRVEPTAERLEFRTGDEVWDWVTNSNPLATGIIAPLTKDQRREVRETLEAMVRERAAGADRVELNCLVHVAIGTR